VLLGALAILFVFVEAAGGLGLPIVVGAFLAGVSLSVFPVNGIVRAELAPIGDFFVAVFFTALGAVIRLPNPTELWQAAVLALMLLVVTPPLVMLLAERRGFSSKPAVEAGLLLSQTSEISLVVILAGVFEGQVPENVFVVIAMVTLATMLLTPFVATDEVAQTLARLRPGRQHIAEAPSDHILLVGAGSTGMPLLEDLIVSGCRLAVLDDDPGVVGRLRKAGVTAIRGEATDPEALRRAGAPRARAVTSMIRRTRDNAVLLKLAPGVPILIRVFEDSEAEWVRWRGGEPVLFADAAAEALMDWYVDQRAALTAGAAERTADLVGRNSESTPP
jgi:CPA2 family monovalent cation:H+ antiporter-2